MKISFRLSASVFAGVQAIGLTCMCTWHSVPLVVASFFWGTSIVALFPGNVLSAMLIEKLFWNSDLSLAAMVAAQIPVLIAINAALWFALVKTVGLLRQRFR
jgi:hypothetical protein